MKWRSDWSLWVVVSGNLVGLLLLPHDAVGGLYQCRTDNGLIYTDTPAQLTQCTPIVESNGTSSVGIVAGPIQNIAPPTAPALPALQQERPPISDAIPVHSDTAVPSPESLNLKPCVPGLNPFNPLTISPCPHGEHSASASPTVQADPNTLPSTTNQP